MSYQVLVEYLQQGGHLDICFVGCGIVALEVTVHFSSVISLKNDVGIENMKQEEFVFFYKCKNYYCACTHHTPYYCN